jgi:hypothetical protein
MTLVLNVATPAYSLHVSDRLVSKGGMPHDPLANKSVVFRATDGLLAFGYTGAAFLERAPTDSWIADALSGGSCTGDIGGVRYGQFPVSDVGSSLLMMCRRLRADQQFQELGGEISAVGWQWDGKRTRALVRNVLWVLHGGTGRLQWQQIVPRHLPERKTTFRMVATGDWALAAEDWRRLLRRVGAAGTDWEFVESLLVEAIRQASALTPGTIGSHCMSIRLRPWRFPNALIRFIPEAAHHGTAFGQTVEVAYSPWMIAPDAIHAPVVLVGGLSCEQGLLTYSMQASPVPEGQTLKAAFQSQDRPHA